MNNICNYFSHILYQPNSAHGQIDKLGLSDDYIIRISKIAIPFIGLYEPLKQPLALILNAGGVFVGGAESVDAFNKKKWKECALKTADVAALILIFSSQITRAKIGLFLANSYELTKGIAHLTELIRNEKYEEAIAESTQVALSALYLAFMVYGTLELTLALLVVQTALLIYEAQKELKNENYPEALAYALMAMVRVTEAKACFRRIQFRNAFLEIEKYYALYERAVKGREVAHLYSHLLNDLDKKIDEGRVELEDVDGKKYDFGAHFHGFGKHLVKGANLELTKNKEFYQLDFKLNHTSRAEFEKTITQLKRFSSNQIKFLLECAGSGAKEISIKNEGFKIINQKVGNRCVITAPGLGEISVGSSPECTGLYNRVTVKLDAGKNLYNFHELLALVGLESTFAASSEDDILRLKMGHLFRVFFPREATGFERKEEFFKLSTDELKSKMIELNPKMQSVFDEHLDHLESYEIFKGRVRYKIPGIAEKIQAAGMDHLTVALTGAYNKAAQFSRLANILKLGLLSSETRKFHGIDISGLSSTSDFYTGGADSVFTQAACDVDKSMKYQNFAYQSDIRLIISPEAVETGTYQYHNDKYGIRKGVTYQNRPGILKFAKNLKTKSSYGWFNSNEVMIKERVAPSWIEGIIVKNSQIKEDLIAYLIDKRIVDQASPSFNGTTLNQFIQVL